MRVDDAEKCWNDFNKQQAQPAGNGSAKGGNDPGTVYFNDAGDGKTEVTIQLTSDGVVEGDEKTLNQRVDGYLERFKQFAEAR
jgi:hypothetical protein